MGMYDEVIFRCPKCEQMFAEQSKAGKCELKTYGAGSVPAEIATDIDKTRIQCERCKEVLVLKAFIPETVAVGVLTERRYEELYQESD